jgi:hypothetical protein
MAPLARAKTLALGANCLALVPCAWLHKTLLHLRAALACGRMTTPNGAKRFVRGLLRLWSVNVRATSRRTLYCGHESRSGQAQGHGSGSARRAEFRGDFIARPQS